MRRDTRLVCNQIRWRENKLYLRVAKKKSTRGIRAVANFPPQSVYNKNFEIQFKFLHENLINKFITRCI